MYTSNYPTLHYFPKLFPSFWADLTLSYPKFSYTFS